MKALRFGICALLAFSVLAHGVVEVWSSSAFEIAAGLLFLLWGALALVGKIPELHFNPLLWPFVAFLGTGALQVVAHTSVLPFFTGVELLKLFACFLVFFLFLQAFRTRGDLAGFVGFLIFFGFAVSLFGIAQHFTSNGKIYWIRPVPENGPFFGPYVNGNHFAGFVELIVPLGLALIAFRGIRRDLLPLTGLCTIVPIGALVMTGSRGGILVFAFELGLLVLLSSTHRAHKTRIKTLAAVVLGAFALVAWLGANKAMEKFGELRRGDVTNSRRWSMLVGSAHVFFDHPILGAGLGTLVDAFPKYDTQYDGRVVDHSHNDYIEVLADSGLLGGFCCGIFLFLLFQMALSHLESDQGHFSRGYHAGALLACAGILLHSFVDFNLHIPANLLLFLLQAALATSPVLPSEGFQRAAKHPQA